MHTLHATSARYLQKHIYANIHLNFNEKASKIKISKKKFHAIFIHGVISNQTAIP